MDNASYLTIAGLLSDHDFYRHDHQLIFCAMHDMATDNKPLDVLTVSEWMKGRFINPQNSHDQRTFFDEIGGLAYLGDLAKDTPSSANVLAYAKIVRNYSLKRALIQLCTQSIEQAFTKGSDDETITCLFETAASRLFSLEQKKEAANKGFIALKQAVETQLQFLSSLKDNDGHLF